jgi:2-polyprenyl-6-hydroxyphenyl methylase/3-demethylubiquinone-9 3-methyltransferase
MELSRGDHVASVFDERADSRWNPGGMLHGLGVLLAPVRVPFIVEVLREELGPGPHQALDLGAGGGLLAEALSETGLSVVAMDPSLPSLRAGREHSLAVGSPVKYVGAYGERLPFADGEFDAVVCMEVLEHVEDAGAVVTEAARVLRPGGVFIYSGPNRTFVNRIGLVFLAQDLLGVVPRGTHEWSRLVRPVEMDRHMRSAGIEPGGTIGIGLRAGGILRSAVAVLRLLFGRITYPEAARRIDLVSGTATTIAYQGFGRRGPSRSSD